MLPLLALIPGLLFTGAKYVAPIIEDHSKQLVPILTKVLSDSPTGKKLVDAFESVLGPIESGKKQAFTIELDSMLGQIDIDKIDAASPYLFVSGSRSFLFYGLSIALLMSVLVEPTLQWVFACFHITLPTPFILSPLVMSILSALLGIHQVTKTVEKSTGK